MKLLIFSPFYPPHIGGLESHADEFNRHLAKRGVKITVFTPRLPVDALEEEMAHETVRIFRFLSFEPIHNYPVPKFWLPEFWDLLSQSGAIKPDIVISRTRFFAVSLLALAYAKWRHIPLLHIEHGSDYAAFNGKFKTFLGKYYDHTFGWIVLRFADRVIANSNASAAFVKRLSGRDAAVIYRGVETGKILATEPEKEVLKEKSGKAAIVYVGRLIDGKGVADLLAALETLDRDDFICHIVGDGPERTRLEVMAKRPKLDGKIRFFGHREHGEAIAIMKAGDIIVNPSYGEGLPTSVTEAALAGKAIIATVVGGTPEIISGKDDGFLIPPKNDAILAEKIGYLLDHPEERERFGKNAHDEVIEKFSWDHAADRYLEVFAELLENRKR